MHAIDREMLGLPVDICSDGTAYNDRLIELRDLKISRAIGIKIGFAIEFAEIGNLCMDGTAELHSFSHSFCIEYGQGSRLACAHIGDVGVRLIAKTVRSDAKELRLCIELDVDL